MADLYLKIFIAKQVISILVNLRYLRYKLLKYKENKKICNTFDHNLKNIPLYSAYQKKGNPYSKAHCSKVNRFEALHVAYK